ncbi:junction plakoglobin-like isoform X2 [Tigriopus californicus]|nr:junction plakoglobin-like isoform X2 [Tigriopus californicus]
MDPMGPTAPPSTAPGSVPGPPGSQGGNPAYPSSDGSNQWGGPVDEGNFGPRDQTFMWQQNHYLQQQQQQDARVTESGFISGSTTQPPSMSGHEEDMDGNYVGGPGSITGSSLYDLDSMAQSEVSSIHSSQGFHTEPDDFIPQLVTALADDDQYVVDQCLVNVEKFLRKDNFLKAMIRSEPLINALVMAFNHAIEVLIEANNNPTKQGLDQASDRARSATNIMGKLSKIGDGRKAIVVFNALPGLVQLLACPLDRIMFLAIAAVHNLLLYAEDGIKESAKNGIRQCQGVQTLTKLLNRQGQEKLLAIVTDCLRLLAVQNSQTKKIILDCGGPQLLVQIMKNETYKSLLTMTSRLLKVLSVCPNNKVAIIQAGGIDAIAKHLGNSSNQTKSHCIWALRNLSDAASTINDVKSLIESLVELLEHKDEHIAICAAGIIFNLTCNNEANKLQVCQSNGIQALVGVIKNLGTNKDLLEPAVCALRHVTNNHVKADVAQTLLLEELNALPLLMGLLDYYMKTPPFPHWPSIKAILGLLRNLAQRPGNQFILRDKGCVVHCKDFMKYLVDSLLTGRLSNQPVENVRLQAVIEIAAGVIYAMSKEPQNRTILREPHLILILNKMMGSPSENIQRISCGTLEEISSDPMGASMLAKEASFEALRNLSNSKNEKITGHIHAILFNIESVKKIGATNLNQPMQSNIPQRNQMQGVPNPEMYPPPYATSNMPGNVAQQRNFGPGFDQGMMNQPQQQLQHHQQQQQQQQQPPHQQVPMQQQQQLHPQQFGDMNPHQSHPTQPNQFDMDDNIDFMDMGSVMSPDFSAGFNFFDNSLP